MHAKLLLENIGKNNVNKAGFYLPILNVLTKEYKSQLIICAMLSRSCFFANKQFEYKISNGCFVKDCNLKQLTDFHSIIIFQNKPKNL